MENQEQNSNNFGKKIIISIIAILIFLAICIGIGGYNYFKTSLKPLDVNNKNVKQINIPLGASTKKIGSILQDEGIIKSGTVFSYYVDSNKKGSFKAGYYQLNPSMTLKSITGLLQKGGSEEPIQSKTGNILIKEGANINEIANGISNKSDFSKKEFLNLMKDKKFINNLINKYPKLLQSATKSDKVNYALEGYLYPATYMVKKNDSLKDIVEKMVSKTDQILTPYYKEINKKKLNVHKVLTLASLLENLDVSNKDKSVIAGIYMNRLQLGIPLQSDISSLYEIRKQNGTLSDKELWRNSQYNLYVNPGYGPGPHDNPTSDSIKAVLNPTYRKNKFLYYLIDLNNDKVYYARNANEQQIDIDTYISE
ncbi:endolytic transglycosylase MltG [Lactobacillus sp. S2-2]|uniref:endolytic transglycosylase MltG n=1 Tax=Lactobacillus sp. S2-2 TaxID=2692917 RepID=UPI001F02D4AD|nr:endolytic transglycosylase MltG [Lactobacillus sp. S2-2]MCF6515130.1 endolytic transglycosylase MltG [Lactobacillus sp. S2-2]